MWGMKMPRFSPTTSAHSSRWEWCLVSPKDVQMQQVIRASGLRAIAFTGAGKSISDDDLCAGCANCHYQPGESSGCGKGWPGREDEDGYVQECAEHQ